MLTISEVGSIGIYIHIGKDSIEFEYNRSNRFVMFIANDRSFCIIRIIRNRINKNNVFKDTMQFDRFHTSIDKSNYDKMASMADLRIDIMTIRK